MTEVVSTQDRVQQGGRSPVLMLAMATIGFAVNFWAWALISPLGPMFRDTGTLGDLTESDVALLVAVPVLVGSLGRIVVGALTDRYGGRRDVPAGLGGHDRARPLHRASSRSTPTPCCSSAGSSSASPAPPSRSGCRS